MSTGKFHGLTAAITPIGSWTTRIRLFVVRSWVDGCTAPVWRSTSSDARRKWSTVNSSISSRDSRMVLPTSIEIIRAISSLRSMHMSNARRQISTRSSTEVARQAGKAALAAATAASTCAGVDACTDPTSSPVDGLWTSIRSPSPSTHWPPMNAPVGVATIATSCSSRSMTSVAVSPDRTPDGWSRGRPARRSRPAGRPRSRRPRARPAPPAGRRSAPARRFAPRRRRGRTRAPRRRAPAARSPSITREASRRANPRAERRISASRPRKAGLASRTTRSRPSSNGSLAPGSKSRPSRISPASRRRVSIARMP